MKTIKILLICSALLIVLTGCGEQENTDNNNSSGTRTSTEINTEHKETLISTYATPIKDNSHGRLVNISITCNTLNGTFIEPNQVFSFNAVVGQPSSARGYQEASIIIDDHTATGIGGGNCQVSSTIYNAVLNAGNFTIVERHEHGKPVTYVPKGRDAAVSYGSLDLKFRNDTGHRVRLDAISDNKNITINLVQID